DRLAKTYNAFIGMNLQKVPARFDEQALQTSDLHAASVLGAPALKSDVSFWRRMSDPTRGHSAHDRIADLSLTPFEEWDDRALDNLFEVRRLAMRFKRGHILIQLVQD